MNLKLMKHIFNASGLKAAKVASFPYNAKNPMVPFFKVVLKDGSTRDLISVHDRLRPWYEALAMTFNKFSKLVAVTEAAIELAQLKNIKESIEGWKHLVASGGLLAQEVDHANREIALMQEDYEARKEPAWEALRKALGELEEG